jgi:hypothetical protein
LGEWNAKVKYNKKLILKIIKKEKQNKSMNPQKKRRIKNTKTRQKGKRISRRGRVQRRSEKTEIKNA